MSARVLFVHPDLGIGGAERLVVDAALALQERGHVVDMYTSHHDPSHCFVETKDGTLRVHVRGDFLPRHIFHKAHIVCSIMRNLYLAFTLMLQHLWSCVFGGRTGIADVIIVDQLSICIPILNLTGARILFYCHFPDLLLTKRTTLLKKLYRLPVDFVEEITTGMADRVLVNSKFTAGVYDDTFKRIKDRLRPEVLYPSINLAKYDDPTAPLEEASFTKLMFLSINRFERKKNIKLAVDAFALLLKSLSAEKKAKAQLFIAGGYDDRVQENVQHYHELKEAAESNGLSTADFPSEAQCQNGQYPDLNAQVVFLRSFSERQRSMLLRRCIAVVYTPTNEHFGIVPVEAMYARRPVIATATGGPLESVKTDETGYLCAETPEAFAGAMRKIVDNPPAAKAMGVKGRAHVIENFSLQVKTCITDRPWG